jgi:predicted MFS family arabinose efflux permease
MPDPALLKPDSIRLLPLAAPLALTQIIGWGTTFWLPPMLAGPLARELAMPTEAIFGGVTVMLLFGAVVAPRFGRLVDAHGARWPMVAGSLFLTLALLAIAHAQGTKTYLLGWMLIGLGMPLVLTQAPAAAIAQMAGPKARQAIGLLMLLGGLSSSVFWPLGTVLEPALGWRGMCLVFAALNLAVCAPVHAIFVAPLARAEDRPARHAAGTPPSPALAPERRRAAFILMAGTFSLTGFISWGLPLQLVELLRMSGHPLAFAVFVGSLMGPAQVASRLAEMTFGRAVGILTVGLIATALMPFAMLLPVFGPASAPAAVAFVLAFGLSAGAMTVVRNVAPLALFGKETYATMSGRLNLPLNVAFAMSPMVFAFLMRQAGPTATLLFAFGTALVALGIMAMLQRRFGRDALA